MKVVTPSLILVTNERTTAICVTDLAVTAGKDIDFLARNGSLIGKTVIADASTLVGMAYDDDSYTMFLSDANNRNHSIFSVDLSAKNVTAKPILKSEYLQIMYIVFGMTFFSDF